MARVETKNLWLITLAAVVSAALYPIFLGQFYLVGDMHDVFVPLETFFRQELLAGRLPAWNPDIAWGYPVIASAQIGFFYPPLLLLRFLPVSVYLPLVLLGHLSALAIGTFIFLRSQGRTPAAAYFGSIAFTLGSFVIQHLTHLNIILTIAWLPWQFIAVDRLARQYTTLHPRGVKKVIAAAVAVGLPFLAGQLHVPTLMALISLAYFMTIGSHPLRAKAKIIVGIFFLAFAIAAAQLLPTAELLWQSSRGPSGDFDVERANQHSFPLYHLPTTLFPRFFGNDDTYWGKRLQIEYGIFIGSIPLMLALYAIFSPAGGGVSPSARGGGARFFRWLLIVSFLLALGSLSPFRLIGLEPTLWVFSAPARWLLFTTFALAYFAAVGFDNLTSAPRRFVYSLTGLALGLGIISAAVTIIFFAVSEDAVRSLNTFVGGAQSPEYYSRKLAVILVSARAASLSLSSPFTALPIITLGTLPFIINRRHARQLIAAVSTAELLIIAATTNPAAPWKQAFDLPPTIRELPQSVLAGQARILSISPAGDTGRYLTNPATRAGAVQRQIYRELLIPLTHASFSIAGVQWPASLDLAGHDNKLAGIRNDDTYRQAQDANIGAVLYQTEHEVNVATLDPAPRSSVPQGAAQYQAIGPSHTQITVDVPARTEVVVRDSFYPGWRATIDGQPTPIKRSHDIFRSVDVAAGQHVITMTYRPALLYGGLIISTSALVICCILALKRKNHENTNFGLHRL